MDRLVSMDDRRKRRKLERDAIKFRWSKNILDREIRERFRRREDRGRTPKPPETPQEALSQLVGILLKLTRWGKAAGWEHERDRIAKGVAIEQLPEELLRELKQTLRAAHRLQDSAEEKLEEYRSPGDSPASETSRASRSALWATHAGSAAKTAHRTAKE